MLKAIIAKIVSGFLSLSSGDPGFTGVVQADGRGEQIAAVSTLVGIVVIGWVQSDDSE